MSESLCIAIAGLVATLVGAFGGSYLTAKMTSNNAKVERVEIRRERLRGALARAIVALREWGAVRHTHNMTLAALRSEAQLKQLTAELVDSYTMEKLIETGSELSRALAETKLLVKDKNLLDALTEVENYKLAAEAPMFTLIWESMKKGEDVVPRSAAVWALSDRYDNAVQRLEEAARELLAVRLED